LIQQVCFHNLVQRNHREENESQQAGETAGSMGLMMTTASAAGTDSTGAADDVPNPMTSSSASNATRSNSTNNTSTNDGAADGATPPVVEKIPLPFIVVNTNHSAIIQCDMSRDRTDVMFDFTLPFEINDDNTILKKMNMDRTSMSTLQKMLPDEVLKYCEMNHLVDAVLSSHKEKIDKNFDSPPRPSSVITNVVATTPATPSGSREGADGGISNDQKLQIGGQDHQGGTRIHLPYDQHSRQHHQQPRHHSGPPQMLTAVASPSGSSSVSSSSMPRRNNNRELYY